MHEKLLVGRYLEMPKFENSKGADVVGGPAHFVSTPGRDYQIQVSAGSGFLNNTRTSQVSAGQNLNAAKVHRNFRWLHWQPGKVTYLPLAGADILTGPMSGCWIVIFTMAATNYVGHIGTYDSPVSPATLGVKAAWAAAFQAGIVNPIAAYQPHGHLVVGSTGLDTFYGVVTANQMLHAMRINRTQLHDTLNQITTMTGVMGVGFSPGDPGHANFV